MYGECCVTIKKVMLQKIHSQIHLLMMILIMSGKFFEYSYFHNYNITIAHTIYNNTKIAPARITSDSVFTLCLYDVFII